MRAIFSLIHLMHAIARAHAGTHATSLIRVKNSMRHLFVSYCLGHWNEENKTTKTSH